MKKLITMTTLSAGIGAAAIGASNHADAAEFNQPHQMNHPQMNHSNMNHSQPFGSNHGYKHSFNHSTTQTSTQSSSSSQASTSTQSSSSSESSTSSQSTTSSSSGNLYTAGQCTWYVYDRVGGKIGSTWGNANNWDNAAQAAGYTVDNNPEKGAILQTDAGGYGHVAYVESVDSDGSVTVSEMNYNGGPYVKDIRTISASQASSYNYIHL